MTPNEQYYENLANQLIPNLRKRHFEAHYCPTEVNVLEKVLSYLTDDSTIAWGGSESLKDIGLMSFLKNSHYHLFDRDLAKTPEEKQKQYTQAVNADFFFMSTNAITLDGQLVNIDGTGNRLSCLLYGPKNVIIIASMNKVVKDLDSALERVKFIACPQNAIRLNRDTPCAKTGFCTDCVSPDCICANTVITRLSIIPNRIKIILVGEKIGY